MDILIREALIITPTYIQNNKVYIAEADEQIVGYFFAFIAQWQDRGQLPAGRDARSLARFFVALATGMNVDARRRCNHDVLEDMVREALTVLN